MSICVRFTSFVKHSSQNLHSLPLILRSWMSIFAGCVSKRGVDDGNQKVGTLSSRHKRAIGIIACFDFRIVFN